MPETPKKFYLTTPIYYVNARPHIGHAYSTIAADVIARRHRLLGEDTFFLTGTDEHGQKVQRSAEAAGIPPQQFTDEVSATFENLWKRMGITNDDYIRTTDDRHKRGVQHLWRVLEERGAIYLSSYTGQYCVSDEAFVDVPLGAPCPECGRTTETITEENYFFRLSNYQLPLIDLIEGGTLHIQPETTRNEVLSFLRGNVSQVQPTELAYSSRGIAYVPGAVKDLSISRTTFDWGIPVPTNEKHVVYVWLDALANYITALGYGSDDPADIAKFEKYWPADIHLVGKEITRFHCVYWPAFLMAAGLPLPKSVVANGWLLFEESKMSKSRGNVVRTETILDAFGPLCPPVPNEPSALLKGTALAAEGAFDVVRSSGGLQPAESTPKEAGALAPGLTPPTKAQQDLFAADVLRYFLLREIPFGQDGTFSFDALITRYNADLANGYGNLVSRTFSMIMKFCGGALPRGSVDPVTRLRASFANYDANYQFTSGEYNFAKSLEHIGFAITRADQALSAAAPWKLAKQSDEESQRRLQEALRSALETIQVVTIQLHPFMPAATRKVYQYFGVGEIEDSQEVQEWPDQLALPSEGDTIPPIFPRADKGLAQIMTDMENPTPAIPKPAAASSEPTAEALNAVNPATDQQPATDTAQPATPSSPTISIDDFVKVDLRVAQIVAAERIPKADKLLRLEVDLGYERRQILAGIAEYYAPETLIGRKVVIVANLAPRKMRGLESNGMIVAASIGPAGAPVLAGFLEDVELGARLK
jgi:methionyl-tRNA synthetase